MIIRANKHMSVCDAKEKERPWGMRQRRVSYSVMTGSKECKTKESGKSLAYEGIMRGSKAPCRWQR